MELHQPQQLMEAYYAVYDSQEPAEEDNTDLELYEQIVEFLISEGYVEDQDSADSLIDEMDDEEIQEIYEAINNNPIVRTGTSVNAAGQKINWVHKHNPQSGTSTVTDKFGTRKLEKERIKSRQAKNSMSEDLDLYDIIYDYLVSEGYEASLDEGLGSAIKRVFGMNKKQPQASEAQPQGRTAQLRQRYGVTSRTGDNSPRGKILSRMQAQINADARKHGQQSSAVQASTSARNQMLKGGYSQFGMNDARGRGNKARERARQLQSEELDLYDIISDYLVSEGFCDSAEDAAVIMVNMSEDWRESIVKSALEEGFVSPYKASPAHGRSMDNPGRLSPAMKALRKSDDLQRTQPGSERQKMQTRRSQQLNRMFKAARTA